jgi:flagellar basal-body rod protein FlgG
MRAGKSEVGKLLVVSLGNPNPLGGSRWAGEPGEAPEGTSMVQGAVEGSNADTMRGMIEMIEASRFFEAQQKAIQTSDDTRARLNRIGGN